MDGEHGVWTAVALPTLYMFTFGDKKSEDNSVNISYAAMAGLIRESHDTNAMYNIRDPLIDY